MKRFTQWAAALFLAIAVCFPAFGIVRAVTPSASQTGTITVTNGPAGGKVTAYPVLTGRYNTYGLLGYAPSNTAVLNALVKQYPDLFGTETPTADTLLTPGQITEILNYETAKTLSAIRTQMTPNYEMTASAADPTTYTASVPAGAYIVVVENPADSARVYNVGMVSVNYKGSGDDSEITDGSVDLESTWQDSNVLKSQEPTLDKTITNPDENQNESENGAAFDKNAPIALNVKTQIPNYNTGLYTEVTYKISDAFSAGLTLLNDAEHPFTVTVGTQTVTAGPDTYTLTVNDANDGFTVAFSSAFILKNIGQPVELNYFASISGDQYNFDGTSNTAKVEYSTNPNDSSATQSKEDKTYHYTFAIDGTVNGTNSEVNEELVKVNETYEKVEGQPIETTARLAGAEFGIWKGTEAAGEPLQSVITDANGLMNFKGLDAGTYVVKEIKAPNGYTLNDELINVVIAAEYETDGQLKSYTITINGDITNSYEINNTGEAVSVTKGDGNESFPIKNTKIPELPSTGGAGTIALTASGAALMGAAAIYLIGKHRKEQK